MSHTKEMTDLYNKFKERYRTLGQSLSKYDLLEQQILHYIEIEKYSAASGSLILKKLREVRLLRRDVKEEYYELEGIIHRLENGKINKIQPRTSNLYSIPLSDILDVVLP